MTIDVKSLIGFPVKGTFYLEDHEDPFFLLDRPGYVQTGGSPYTVRTSNALVTMRTVGTSGSDTDDHLNLNLAEVITRTLFPGNDNSQWSRAWNEKMTRLIDMDVYLVFKGEVDHREVGEAHVEVGVFGVEQGRHVRLYGRTTQIPQDTIQSLDADVEEALSSRDVDMVMSGLSVVEDEAPAKIRKRVTNEILGVTVDLLKAGSGHYDGQAAQTIRNLVAERLREIVLTEEGGAEYERELITKAKVRMTDLGMFVLGTGTKFDYYRRAIDTRLSSMMPSLARRPTMQVVQADDEGVKVVGKVTPETKQVYRDRLKTPPC
jgi:hypothetical protein